MYLDLCAYLLVSKRHQANFTSHHMYSEHTFCAKHDIQSPWKYFLNTSQDSTVQEGCDCTVSYTQ